MLNAAGVPSEVSRRISAPSINIYIVRWRPMWTQIGSLEIGSGRLSISDSSFFFDFPLIVDSPPGAYFVEAVEAQDSGHDLIERVRLVGPAGAREPAAGALSDHPSRGDHLGYVSVQFAQLGLCDRTQAEAAFASLDEDGLNTFTSQMSLSTLTGVARFPNGTAMFLVKPGFGDLDSAAFELLRDGQRCGVELVFVEPDARTPP